MSEPDFGERSLSFGRDVIRMCRELSTDHVSRPLVSQLVRSGTSIGANFAEARNAASRKDFRNKLIIAKKEADETKHWLCLLAELFPGKKDDLRKLWRETDELVRILQASVTTVSKSRTSDL